MSAKKATGDADPYADVPVLPGWLSLPDAGDRLRVTRQRIFQLADNRQLQTLHRILGSPSEDPTKFKRPALLVVSEAEIEEMLTAQRAAGAPEAEGDSAALAS